MGDEREFKINLTGDASGIVEASRQSDGALKGVAGAQAEAGNQAEKHSVHIRGLHRLFHGLNEIVPGLGVLMQAAFSPVGAAISIAFMALRAFHEKMKEFDEECRKAAEEAAKPLTNRLAQQRETTVRTAEGMEQLRERLADAARGQEGLKNTTEKAIVSLKAQQVAAESLNDAAKGNELASMEERHAAGLISEEQYASARLEIEQKYQEKKRELAEREEMTEILIKKRLLEQAEMKQPELTAAAGAAEKAKEKALEDLGSYDKAGIDENKKKSAAALKAYEEKRGKELTDEFQEIGPGKSKQDAERWMQANNARGGAYHTRGSDYYEEWDRLKRDSDMAEKAAKQAPGEEARLKVASEHASHEAERLAKKAEENQTFSTDTGKDVSERRLRYDARHRANQELTDLEHKTDETKRVDQLIHISKSPEAQADTEARAAAEWSKLPPRERANPRRALTASEVTEAGVAAVGDLSGAVGTAQAFEAHKQTTTEQQRQLMEVTAAIAGHRVSFREAVAMMSAVGNDIGLFTKDVGTLVTVMKGLSTEQSRMAAEIRQIKAQHRDTFNQ